MGRAAHGGGPAISEQEPLEALKAENHQLRERLAEMERRLGEAGGAPVAGSGITQLIRSKDLQIEESKEELRAKAEEAARTAAELAARNGELVNSMAALRLYQLMFENDPNGLVGINADGTIVQFNSSALRFLGYDLHRLRLKSVSELDLPGSGVDFRAVFDETMKAGEAPPVECRLAERAIWVSCYRLEDMRGQRGAVFRISDTRSS